MDVRMPVMTGLEATAKIRTRPLGQDTIIIALTASALDNDRRRVMEGGVDDFLSKPCREDQLLEKIQAHFGLTYAYADHEESEPAGEEAVASAGLDAGRLAALPSGVIDQMRHAVLAGEKDLLDRLIRKVQESDTRSANTLKGLADKYEYDALINLLQETCK